MEISIWWLIPTILFSASVGLLAGVLCLSAGKVSRELEQEVKHIDTRA